MLLSGALVVYLRSRTEQGCDSFLGCGGSWAPRGDSWKRRNNWWNFYCDGFERSGSVASCLQRAGGRAFRCYTSEDANWTLNAALLHRLRALGSKLCCARGEAGCECAAGGGGRRRRGRDIGPLSLAEVAEAAWARQDGLEVGMLNDDWGRFKVPLCISYQGLFVHKEIDS
jgi:hypothetical protein